MDLKKMFDFRKATPEENKEFEKYRVPPDAVAFNKEQMEVLNWQVGKAMDLVDDYKYRLAALQNISDRLADCLDNAVNPDRPKYAGEEYQDALDVYRKARGEA